MAFANYFETMRIPILRGRGIAASDDSSAAGVVVVNEYLAKRYWPGEDAIGKRITLGSPDQNPVWLTVIGVVKNDVRSEWSAPAEEEMFLPFLQAANSAGPYMTIVARTSGDPTLLIPAARRAIWAIDPSVAIAEVQTMDEVIDRSTTRPRINVLLLGVFASVALVLAAIGIYGVMSYAVSRRVHEIGIRMALGATAADVSRLVVGQGMRVVLVGAGLGLAGAFALTRLMQKLLYGVGATDPLTFVVVPLVLSGVALLANYLPARRATRVDPLSALRAE
jgi:putative ABC transport system permease protein